MRKLQCQAQDQSGSVTAPQRSEVPEMRKSHSGGQKAPSDGNSRKRTFPNACASTSPRHPTACCGSRPPAPCTHPRSNSISRLGGQFHLPTDSASHAPLESSHCPFRGCQKACRPHCHGTSPRRLRRRQYPGQMPFLPVANQSRAESGRQKNPVQTMFDCCARCGIRVNNGSSGLPCEASRNYPGASSSPSWRSQGTCSRIHTALPPTAAAPAGLPIRSTGRTTLSPRFPRDHGDEQ